MDRVDYVGLGYAISERHERAQDREFHVTHDAFYLKPRLHENH
jgi:hypothetical protein